MKTEIVKIEVSGETDRDIAKKIVKVYYLLSFLKNDARNSYIAISVIVFTILFFLYIFFGVYMTHLGIFSDIFLGSNITSGVYYYKNNEGIIENALSFSQIVDCSMNFCIKNDGGYIERQLIDAFEIVGFNLFK